MSPAVAAVLGLIVGAIGWMVVGHQRVTEAIVEERRQAYAILLIEADLAASSTGTDRQALHEAITKAEFASSVRMRRSGPIRQVEKLINDGRWGNERGRFMTLARVESTHNALLLRWWHRGWYANSDRIEHVR